MQTPTTMIQPVLRLLKGRAPRQRTLLSGKLLMDQCRTMVDCVVRNMNAEGAMIELGHAMMLPGRINLLVSKSNEIRSAEVRWIRGQRAGVKFISAPRQARRMN